MLHRKSSGVGEHQLYHLIQTQVAWLAFSSFCSLRLDQLSNPNNNAYLHTPPKLLIPGPPLPCSSLAYSRRARQGSIAKTILYSLLPFDWSHPKVVSVLCSVCSSTNDNAVARLLVRTSCCWIHTL